LVGVEDLPFYPDAVYIDFINIWCHDKPE